MLGDLYKHPKCTLRRWRPVGAQRERLLAAYNTCDTPSTPTIVELSLAMHVSQRQVRVWFQNRRQRDRQRGASAAAGGKTTTMSSPAAAAAAADEVVSPRLVVIRGTTAVAPLPPAAAGPAASTRRAAKNPRAAAPLYVARPVNSGPTAAAGASSSSLNPRRAPPSGARALVVVNPPALAATDAAAAARLSSLEAALRAAVDAMSRLREQRTSSDSRWPTAPTRVVGIDRVADARQGRPREAPPARSTPSTARTEAAAAAWTEPPPAGGARGASSCREQDDERMMMSFALDDVLTVLGEQPGAAAAFSVLPAGASERPLFWGGLAIGLSGVVVAVATGRFPIGGPQMAFGPWLMLLSVMPTDRRAIRTALCTWLVLLCAAGAMQILTLGTCTAPPACELYQIGEVYSLVVLGGNVLYASVLLVALLSGDGSTPGTALSGRAPRWLPLRQSRALLHATWRGFGCTLLFWSPAWVLYGLSDFIHPPPDALAAGSASIYARFNIGLGLAMAVLGALALWRPLRATVLALAQATFRSVSLDKLEPKHLASNELAADAYAITNAAPLGSIDAFLSHSWHDSPVEKWRLLQAWRADFVKAHGREPTMWIDRCCIQPDTLSVQLQCLPVYCAGCDTLLALRGPTYLNRLWCVIELYVFYEMRSGGNILVLDFEGTPPYTADGLVWHDAAVGAASESMSASRPRAVDKATAGPRSVSGALALTTRRPSAQGGGRHGISNGDADAEAALPRHSLRSRGSHGSITAAAAAAAEKQPRPFDVRRASCSAGSDKSVLIAVIETAGAGVGSFNAWMHKLLTDLCKADAGGSASSRPAWPDTAPATAVYPVVE